MNVSVGGAYTPVRVLCGGARKGFSTWVAWYTPFWADHTQTLTTKQNVANFLKIQLANLVLKKKKL